MEFRLATINDLSQIIDVYKEIIRDMYEKNIEIWDEIFPCSFFKEDISQNRLYVLIDDGIVAAAFVLCDNDSGSNSLQWEKNTCKALYLDRFGVNVKYARKGIGSLMLKKAEQIAKNSGKEYLRLFVVDINIPAIKLYEKNAFSKAEGIYNLVIDDTLVLHEYGYEKRVL